MPLDASFQSASFTFAGQICWPIDLGHCRDIAKAWDFITRRNMFWEKRLVARFWKMVFWHRFLFHVFPLFNIFCLLSVAIFSRGFTLQPSTWQRTQWKSVVPEFYWIYMKASENSSKFRSPSSPSNISREHATRFTLHVLPVLSIGTNSVHCAHGAIAYHSGVWPSVDVQFCWSAFTFWVLKANISILFSEFNSLCSCSSQF